MVLVAPFSVAAVFTIICLIGIWYCLTFGLRPFLQQVIGPVQSVWPDAALAIDNAVNALANWALNWLNQLMDQAYQWIQVPAANVTTLLNKVSDFGYSTTNALIRLHNRIGAAESTIGSWTATVSISGAFDYLTNQAAGIQTTIAGLSNGVNTLLGGTAQVITDIYSAIGTAASGAVTTAGSYTDTAISAVYTLIASDVQSLNTSIGNLTSYAQGIDANVYTQAASAVTTAEGYTDRAISALDTALTSYVNTSISGLRTELIDDVSRATSSLQASISGVSNDLKAQVATVAANLAAADASLSSDLKQQLSSLATQISQTTGALSDQLKADYAAATASILAVRDTLSSALTADVASLADRIVQTEGTLSADLQGQIADVAASAQAARNALNVSLTAAIASVAVQAASTARTLAADEANCINPTCDAFLPQAAATKALLNAAMTGVFLAVIDAAIMDPAGTAKFAQPLIQGFGQPIFDSVKAQVP